MDILEIIKAIKQDRFDLSDYLIHFTRKKDGKESFEVLKEIVHSGQINCGWSVRNNKRTIFGSKPAICFTDMPLYSFYRYVNNRNDVTKVDFYGVAIHKKNMFRLGARNVIYGTTTEGETENKNSEDEWTTPDLPMQEQYRYMLTKINDINDWTHEREWRWVNHLAKSKGDHLPLWKNNEYVEWFGDIEFYQEGGIFILVRDENEVDELEKIFQTFIEKTIYNKENIARTWALSLENLMANNKLEYNKLSFVSLAKDGICRKMPNS